MSQDQNPKGDFEERLLAGLRAIVAEREPEHLADAASTAPAWRRGPRLAVAGGAVAAVTAAVLIVGAGGRDAPAAYAVTPDGDGDVSVEIRSLDDPEGLESALAAAGVPAEVEYAATEECESGPVELTEATEAVPTVPAEAARLTIDPDEVGPGETLELTAVPAEEGIAVEAQVAVEPSSTETLPAEAELGELVEEDEGPSTCGIPASSPGVRAVPAEPEASGFRRPRSR